MPEPIIISIPLSGAVDEQTAKQWLDPNRRSVSVVNGLIYKENAVDKRLGLSLVVEDREPGISKAVRLTPWTKGPQQLVAVSDSKSFGLYDWSAIAEARQVGPSVEYDQGLVLVSELPEVAVRRTPVITNPSPEAPWILDVPVKTGRDAYEGTTLRLTLFRETPSYDLYATVVDRSTGQVVLHKTLVYANTGTIGEATAPYPVALFCPRYALPGRDACLIVQDNANTNRVFLVNYDYVTNSMTSAVLLSTATGQGAGLGLCDAAPFLDHPSGNFIYMSCRTIFGTEVHLSNFTSDGSLVSDRVMPMPSGKRVQNAFAIEGRWGGKCHFITAALQGTLYSMEMFQTEGDDALTPDPGVAQPWTFDTTGQTSAQPSGCCRIADGQLFVHIVATIRPSPGSAILTQTGSWYNLNDVNDYVGNGHTPFGYVPVAKPFALDGHVYEANYFELIIQSAAGAAVDRSEQITLYLNRYSRLQELNALDPAKVNDYVLPVACSAPRQVDAGAGYLQTFALGKKPFMSQVELPGPGGLPRRRYAFGIRTRGSGTPAIKDRIGPSWATDFYFDEDVGSLLPDQFQPTELLGELGLSGGVQFVSDGLQATEDSFFAYPEFSYATLESPNTRPLEGQYIYAVCYSYVDAAGLVHRSVPAFTNPVECTTYEVDPPFGLAPRLHIPVLSATWRDVLNPRQVFAEIYRTQSNGSVFYFLDRVLASGLAWNDYEVEWPSSTSTDQVTDETLETASLLYTTGNGELDNVNPPASFLSIVHKDRRAIVDETGLNVWFTKQANSPVLAPGWNESLQIAFPEGGQITAMASMDGTFIAFKRGSIWKVYGSGPPNNGQSSDWTVPEAIVTDVGAVSWRSVCETPMGFVFQATTGFHILTRSLTVEYIGQDVQDKIAAYPEVVRATVVTTNSSKHVRWTCRAPDGALVVIVWDYDHKSWSFFEYPTVDTVADTAMVVERGDTEASYCILGATGPEAGRTWIENSRQVLLSQPTYPVWKDQRLDGTYQFIPTVIRVGGVRLGVQAGQRTRVVQLLAEPLNPCGLRMEMAFNDAAEPSQVEEWDTRTLQQLPVPGQVQAFVAAAFTRSQSVEVTLSDVDPPANLGQTVTGRGARFVNLTFELEPLGSRWKQIPGVGRR